MVLDRAGLTGDDGASHNGMWDLAILGVVPGLRIAAPRDEPTLRAELGEAVAYNSGPSVVRFPKSALGPDIPALRAVGTVDVLSEDSTGVTDVLIIAVGATAADAEIAAEHVRSAGHSVRIVDPRWVNPVEASVVEVARSARLVVTVEDGVVAGGVGSRIAQALRADGLDVPVRHVGIPVAFLDHGKLADVRAKLALTGPDIGRTVLDWAESVLGEPAISASSATHSPNHTSG